ncbi:MAG: hypothetical protein AABW80_04015 [Nanoarchaeota archaeon]
MHKKRFYVKLGVVTAIIVIAIIVNIFYFKSFTGAGIRESFEKSFLNDKFVLKMGGYNIDGQVLRADYMIQEIAKENHELDIYYELYSSENVYASGQDKVVLGANDEGSYALSIKIPDNIPQIVSLFVEAKEGDSRSIVIQQVILDYNSITGNVVEEQRANTGIAFLIFVVILVVLFYVAEFVLKFKERERLGEGTHYRHFIDINNG